MKRAQITEKGIIRGYCGRDDIIEITGKLPVAITRYSLQEAGHDYWCGYWGHSYHVNSVTKNNGLYDIDVMNEGRFPNVHGTFLNKGDYELIDFECPDGNTKGRTLIGAEWKALFETGRLDAQTAETVDRCMRGKFGISERTRYKIAYSKNRGEYYLAKVA